MNNGPRFVLSMKGRRMLKLNRYTYYPTSIGPKIRWRCSSQSGCKATVHTYEDHIISLNESHTHPPKYIRKSRIYKTRLSYKFSRRGNKLLVLNGYTFYHQKTYANSKARWVCTRIRKGCRSYIQTFHDVVIYVNIASFVYSRKGNKMILLSGYTFYRHTTFKNNITRWLCGSHHKRGCKALIHSFEETIVKVRAEHNHEPLPNSSIYYSQPA
uniref:SFRICE_004212 n=1 Tax=Spodoptera frugiperda TaxID=7108 RepID=A0A2H1VGK0_SPOFR